MHPCFLALLFKLLKFPNTFKLNVHLFLHCHNSSQLWPLSLKRSILINLGTGREQGVRSLAAKRMFWLPIMDQMVKNHSKTFGLLKQKHQQLEP